MEKNEKLETLTKLIGALGLQTDEVVAYLQKKEQPETEVLTKPKDLSAITLLPSKKIITPREIEPGMLMYADGLVYPGSVEGNQITSVVGYVGKNEALAVCLEDKKEYWSSDKMIVGSLTSNKLSGKEATQLILNAARRQGKRAEAAQYCFEYAKDGVEAGEAFLPTTLEWDRVYRNKERVKNSLNLIHAFGLNKIYWSSLGAYNFDAWFFDFCGGYENGASVTSKAYVRPFLSFTF